MQFEFSYTISNKWTHTHLVYIGIHIVKTRLKTYKTSTAARHDRPGVIASFCGLGNCIDRSRQLISMTTVNLGVVCKLIFAFLPENIGVR